MLTSRARRAVRRAGAVGRRGRARGACCSHAGARAAPTCGATRVGNLVARVGGSGPRCSCRRHMDQVGYVVRHVTDDGFLLLDTAQGDRRTGPERRHPVGQPVALLARDGRWLDGLIAAAQRPRAHPRAARERTSSPTTTSGSSSGSATATRYSRPGCTSARRSSSRRRCAGSASCCRPRDGQPRRARGDGRAARRHPDGDLACELWLGATVQEENGLHGARALALARSASTPRSRSTSASSATSRASSEREYGTRLGDGPIVVHRDTGHRLRPRAHPAPDRARAAARRSPSRTACSPATGPTASRSPRPASPTALLTVPTRYTHTAFETIHPRDLDTTADLLRAFLTAPLPHRPV